MMKKFFFFFVFGILLTACAFTSCDNTHEAIIESVNELPNDELTKLYISIDSLHSEYSEDTRGAGLSKWGRRFLVATVDACVGAITAESGLGAFVCSTVASGVYEDYLNTIDKRGMPNLTRSSSTVPLGVVFPTNTPCFVDSIGYYHNFVINNIKSKGKLIIVKNGEIDYDAYYNEVIAVAKEHCIACRGIIDKPLVFRYLDSIIKPFAQLQEGNEETILSIIFNETYNDFNFDNTQTLVLRNICEKIIYNDLSVNEDQIIEYGTKVNDLIENSKVGKNTKETMKIANNIAVNSSLYWSTH